jgi:hypothetical protein
MGVAQLVFIYGPHRIGDIFAESDLYGGYIEGARLVQGGHLEPGRYGVIGPVYEIVLALVALVVRDFFLAGEWISLFATGVAAFLWFRLLERRTHAVLGAFAVLFLVSNAYFFHYGYAAVSREESLRGEVYAIFRHHAEYHKFGIPRQALHKRIGVTAFKNVQSLFLEKNLMEL